MNADNIDFEQLRRTWIEMGESFGMKPSPDADPENLNKKKTALERLRDKYLTFWIVALLMIAGSFQMFPKDLFGEGKLTFWLKIAFASYFLIVFCMDHWLWRGIGSISLSRMGVSEVVRKVMFYRKRHLQFMVVLIPLAVALVGYTGYVFSSQTYFLNGLVVGAFCGLIIGTIQFRRFMAVYKNISE